MGSVNRMLRAMIPCVGRFLLSTLLDGWAAWRCVCATLFVLFCFFTGRSHLAYPQPLAWVRRRKAERARRRQTPRAPTDSPPNTPNTPNTPTAPLPGVRRRLLCGRGGARAVWLPPSAVRPLVAARYPLCASESLHRLVANVVGPIQQPTVDTLPTRHTAPQWPPHIPRRARPQPPADAATTDEYSSSASAPRRPQREAETAVVYRRESSARVQFDRPVPSRMPPHPIAPITAHHVLSYQATRQKVLVLDLDETLCHVSTRPHPTRPPTFSEVIPTASGAELFHVWERPHARLFLRTMAKLFNVALFTSSTKPYADSILRRMDPEQRIARRFYRQHCRLIPRAAILAGGAKAETHTNSHAQEMGKTDGMRWRSADSSFGGDGSEEMVLVKDLRVLKVPPELMIMIDNAEDLVVLNRENALVIPPFFPSPNARGMERETTYGEDSDTTRSGTAPQHEEKEKEKEKEEEKEDNILLSLIPFLEALLVVPDARSVLRHGRPPTWGAQ